MSFVKLNRALRDNPVASDPHYLAIWTWLLMLAAYKAHSVILHGTQVDLKAGELATSVRILADKSGVKKDKILAILGLLDRSGMIRRRKTNKHTVITLINWSKYQVDETVQRHNSDATQTGEKKGKEREEETTFPEELDTPDFRQAWAEWVAYRKDMKKKLSKFSIRKQLKQLAAMGEQGAIACIDHTIAKGWQGLYEPKQEAGTPNGVTIDEAFLQMDCQRGGANGSL